MSITEAILVVVVILLTVWIFKSGSTLKSSVNNFLSSASNAATGAPATTENFTWRKMTPEQRARKEHMEYFDATNGGDHASDGVNGGCTSSDGMDYGVHPFGGADMDYRDWITGQAVDQAVVKNHSEFVKDQLKSGATGKTFTPDTGDGMADMIPWVGIRGRPQAIPESAMGNPD